MKHIYERQVYYYETDRMGIVHHSNYIRWFEEARMLYLKNIDVDYRILEDMGILVPVLSVSSKYRKSFTYGDTFRVESHCTFFNGFKFDYEYKVYNVQTGELCNTGTSSHCFLTKDMKPLNVKKTYPQLFEKLDKGYREQL